MAGRTVAGRRAGQVHFVGLLPRPADGFGDRGFGRVVQPSVPLRRDGRRLDRAAIRDPPPGPRSRAGTPLLVIDVAYGVRTDPQTVEHREQPGAKVHPPGYKQTAAIGPPPPILCPNAFSPTKSASRTSARHLASPA